MKGQEVREVFTTAEAGDAAITSDGLRWGKRAGAWSSAGRGVWMTGGGPVTLLEQSIAQARLRDGVVSGGPAGALLGLDSVVAKRVDFTVRPGKSNQRTGARRRELGPDRVVSVNGVVCTSALQTLVDLAAELDDRTWEQTLESALRRGLTTIAALDAEVAVMSKARTPGARLIRRVLALRPPGAPATESLLETLAVQLIRSAGLPTPTRQWRVFTVGGRFVARVDLAWPELGVFMELDGQHHEGQPVYDAARQTAVVAATGWLCIRCTWRQIVRHPKATARDIAAVLRQAHSKHALVRD